MRSQLIYKKTYYKYVLAERFFIETRIYPDNVVGNDFVIIYPNGLLVQEKYYAWNGPNFPAIHTEKSILASLPHDGGYQLINEGLLPDRFKRDFDLLLAELVSEPDLNNRLLSDWRKIRGMYYLDGVDLFGSKYIKVKNNALIIS